MALLDIRGLTVRYGGLAANDEIDLQVQSGMLVGLIGPNGAGKTTFIDAITGFTNVSSGVVEFDGVDLIGMAPHQRARLGLSRTFQSLELFEDLSVRDNLRAAAEKPPWYAFALDLLRVARGGSTQEDQVNRALGALGLEDIADRLPSDLSHGQRKLVGVARALAAKPKLLLLDEPAAGLDTTESQLLGAHLRSFLAEGTTIFLIDHDMGLVLNVCDYIYVLDFGRIIASGTSAEVRRNPAVIGAYLGQSAGEAQANAATGLSGARAAGASAVVSDPTASDPTASNPTASNPTATSTGATP